MAVYIEIGTKVVNKKNESGKIIGFDNNQITVEYDNRIVNLMPEAFNLGFLRLEDNDLQQKINENSVVIIKNSNPTELPEQNENTPQQEEQLVISSDDVFKVRLTSAPISFNKVRKKDKELIKKIFDCCDKDTLLFKSFDPKMQYSKYTSYSRSKYKVGFLIKYIDNYVLRVFSRNDIYKKRVKTGVTVLESDTTEIFRVLRLNGRIYYFSKNLSVSEGFYNNSDRHNTWHISTMSRCIVLDEVINKCDCNYLNDYISEKKIYLEDYTKLLFPALVDNKVEIVFKNKLYSSSFYIDDISKYLSDYSHKQIDFASKNNVLNALPIIKSHGLYDLNILNDLESIMRRRYFNDSVYIFLEQSLKTLNLDCSNLYKKVVDFLKKIDIFDIAIYKDYIRLLSTIPNVAVRDFFDKDYITRHNALATEKNTSYSFKEAEEYKKAAKELMWIDRKVDDYYIVVPKTIDDFKYEGQIQHNCVFVAKYYKDVISRRSIIVFLRENKQIPFVTIEYDYNTFEVVQAREKYNQKLDKDLFQFVVSLGKKLSLERNDSE